MKTKSFITLGSKGTSLPVNLTSIEPPLQIGANGIGINKINWSKGQYMKLGKKANGWVSEAKKRDPFYLYPLQEAVEHNQVVHVEHINWISKGRRFTGDAFFPAEWKPGGQQPQYVAVRARGWDHGCLENEWNKNNAGQWIGAFENAGTPLGIDEATRASDADEDPVDVEKEILLFQDSFSGEPATTQQAIIQARRGQGLFRERLKIKWDKQCSVTNCQKLAILHASHIKAWRFANNEERLDPFNGLLLTPNLHGAFDLGLISFRDDGRILISTLLAAGDSQELGIKPELHLRWVYPKTDRI